MVKTTVLSAGNIYDVLPGIIKVKTEAGDGPLKSLQEELKEFQTTGYIIDKLIKTSNKQRTTNYQLCQSPINGEDFIDVSIQTNEEFTELEYILTTKTLYIGEGHLDEVSQIIGDPTSTTSNEINGNIYLNFIWEPIGPEEILKKIFEYQDTQKSLPKPPSP